MAGAKQGDFKEIISPFLKNKMDEAKANYGSDSKQYFAISHQYIKSPLEDLISSNQRNRHYESELNLEFEGRQLKCVERLYKRTILIEPTTVCAAHCRWCLRGQYPVGAMSEDDLELAAKYIGSETNVSDLDEVLITGGDPLMSLKMLRSTLSKIKNFASNISTIRIGTRVPFQDPRRINDNLLEILSDFDNFRFEVGINVNHPVEFWPESLESINKLQSVGVRLYNQNPLLKGVNDDESTLIELYENLRNLNVESHYLFHAMPMRGMQHHRTSLDKGLSLISNISSSGEFSGRSKPKYVVLSDIGKIVIYEGTIVDRDKKGNRVLLRSGFNLEQRRKWNPNWAVPESVVLANDGTMLTWYEDGTDI